MNFSLPRGLGLPDFPWDQLAGAKSLAVSHPDGICDLSVGTPVDETPHFIRRALVEMSDAPGYPTVVGTQEVRSAILEWGRRRSMVNVGLSGVIPTIGSKEAVAWIPRMLGVGPGDTVLVPAVAYPTYDIGARLAGAQPIPVDPTDVSSWPHASLVYINSPGNPDGHVLSSQELRHIVEWARTHGAIVVSDECYAALPWEEPWASHGVPSVLDTDVCQGNAEGILVLYSLSKQSNLAGYRAALIYGDPALVAAIVEVRKHAGMMVPAPIQHAMAVALTDSQHVEHQHAVYSRRRQRVLDAIGGTDLVNDPRSVAGLYLWLSSTEPGVSSSDLVERFARMGILVAPGDFYGDAARGYVRVALTATDERIDAAAGRLQVAAAT